MTLGELLSEQLSGKAVSIGETIGEELGKAILAGDSFNLKQTEQKSEKLELKELFESMDKAATEIMENDIEEFQLKLMYLQMIQMFKEAAMVLDHKDKEIERAEKVRKEQKLEIVRAQKEIDKLNKRNKEKLDVIKELDEENKKQKSEILKLQNNFDESQKEIKYLHRYCGLQGQSPKTAEAAIKRNNEMKEIEQRLNVEKDDSSIPVNDHWANVTGIAVKNSGPYTVKPFTVQGNLKSNVHLSNVSNIARIDNEGREMVNQPAHYQGHKFSVIDIIEDYSLDFSEGSVVKYILRYKKKDNPVQDLNKAKWYIERLIENLESK